MLVDNVPGELSSLALNRPNHLQGGRQPVMVGCQHIAAQGGAQAPLHLATSGHRAACQCSGRDQLQHLVEGAGQAGRIGIQRWWAGIQRGLEAVESVGDVLRCARVQLTLIDQADEADERVAQILVATGQHGRRTLQRSLEAVERIGDALRCASVQLALVDQADEADERVAQALVVTGQHGR